MCIFSAVFSAVISENTQIFRDHSFAFDTKLMDLSDMANQKDFAIAKMLPLVGLVCYK